MDYGRRILSIFLVFVTVILCLSNSFLAFASAEENTLYSALPADEEIAAMPEYDGRDYGIITPVKDQGGSNLCWAYSSVAASEASILKLGTDPDTDKDKLSLNPVAAAYRIYNRGSDPLGNTGGISQSVDYTQATGNPLKIAKLFSMWWGPVSGSSVNIDPYQNPTYRFENAFYIPENKSDTAAYIKAIKSAVAKYGAVTFQYNNARETSYYNPKNESGSSSFPHACTIVGWNDNIPASRFYPGGASQNGGWLIKNSYNSLQYFYLSYDNTSSSAYAFTYAPKEKYDYNYYYDGSIDDFVLRKDKVAANVFKAQMGGTDGKDEYLKAVNVGVSGENITVEVQVYKNLSDPSAAQNNAPVAGGTLAGTTSVGFEHGGYVTVELENKIKLEKDEWYSVIVKVSNDKGDAKIITGYKDCENYSYCQSGDNWYHFGNFVARIKAYTKLEETKPKSNFTNLLVFARFDGEDEFINTVYDGANVRKITDNTFNSSDFSVSDYYMSASGGKMNIQSVYLFDGGGSLKLSHERGYYAEYSEQNPIGYKDSSERGKRMYELKLDWSNAVNDAVARGGEITSCDGTVKYDYSDLDKNGDGKIDSITVIYKNTVQNISVSWAAPLWNYKDYADYVSVNADGKTLTSGNYIQLTNSYDYLYKDSAGNVILPTSVATHETGHILGLKDLYNTSGTSPVYFMSAMAKHTSPVPQYISVKEREALGWLDENSLPVISQDGEYTLYAAGVDPQNNIVGYKLNVPGLNKTLYLEYRNFGGNVNKYDSQNKELFKSDGTKMKGLSIKSGLVCYLMNSNMKFPDNMNCTAANWNYQVLGGTYSTKSDAALGLDEQISVGSNIEIYVTGISENSLSFSISGASHEHTGGEATCTERAVCSVCGERYGELDPNNHKWSEWRLKTVPTAAKDGENERVCSLCGVKETVRLPKVVNNCTVSGKFIYGITPKLEITSVKNYISDENTSYKLTANGNYITTGTKVELSYLDSTSETFEFVLFGDVNGDGVYDGEDSIILSAIINGMLTKEQAGDAAWFAADCNRDGKVDASDAELLQKAGLLTANVNQK